jgi:iron complex outermembrane recepter protein
MSNISQRLRQGCCILPFAALAALGTAQAQQSSAPKPEQSVNEVVVTGSLIRRPNNTSVSPIVSLNTETIKQTGAVTLETALNQVPGFTPAGTSATGGQGTGGHVTVNLHGLGSNRNLVLLDGRRLPLADISGNVDINFIPEAIISNVEVITGGASAIYGSDAMSGVVNFKTIPFFNGIKIDAQTGNSFKSDLAQNNFSVAFGTKFDEDRGHLIFSLGYADRDGLSGADRADFFALRTPSSFIGQGTFVPSANNLPTQAAYNTVFSSYGSTATVGRTLNLGFNDDGTLFAQTGATNYKGPTTGLWAIVGGNVRMPVGLQTQLLNGFNRQTAFSKFDYKINDKIKAYGQFLYVDSTVTTASGGSLTQLNTLTSIPVTNPFIPNDLKTILASRPTPTASFTWNGRYVGIPYKSWDENYNVAQFMFGLKGDLAAGWTWDAFGAYDSTEHNQNMNHAVLKSQVQTLLNAADGGASICAGGFNPFGLAHATSLSVACQNYMTTTLHSQEKLTQTQYQAMLQGPVFQLQGGDAHVAFLAGYRKNTYVFTPDSNLVSGNVEAVIATSPVSEHAIENKDFAVQIDLPFFKDLPWVKELGVGAAYRYSDYSTTGAVKSYEGDIRYKPIEALLFRGSYQRAVRAPNIGELFSSPSGVQVVIGTPPVSIGDPCDVRSTARTGTNGTQVAALCVAQGVPSSIVSTYLFPTTATGGIVTGNAALTPETADTFNVGAVFNPHASSPWLRDFNVSVDYYNIKIANVISVVNGLTTLSKCFNLDGTNPTYSQTNSYCQLIQRDANGQLVNIAQPYLNLGGLRTDGVEIQVTWGVRPADVGLGALKGRAYINSTIGLLSHYKVQSLPGSAFQEFSDTNTVNASYPLKKAVTTFGYRADRYSAGLRWRYQAAIRDVSSVLTPATPSAGVPDYNLYDVFATYQLTNNATLRAGINNLMDEDMPVVSSSQNGADPSVFDPIGRSFYVGIKLTY